MGQNDEIVIKNKEFCIEIDEVCIKNKEFCIENDEFCIKNKEFCIETMDYAAGNRNLTSLIYTALLLPGKPLPDLSIAGMFY